MDLQQKTFFYGAEIGVGVFGTTSRLLEAKNKVFEGFGTPQSWQFSHGILP